MTLLGTILLTSVIWISEALVCYLLFVSINVEIFFFLVLFAISVSNLSLVIPSTPGGIGFYELILFTIFVANGVNQASSFSLAILDHGIKLLSVSILGVLFYLLLYFRRLKKSNKQLEK